MLLYQIGLTLLPGVGDVLGKKLVAYCGGVESVFRQKKQALEKIPGIGASLVNAILSQNVLMRAEEEIAFIEKNNIIPLFYLDKRYPQRLKSCTDGPVMLYLKGNCDLNHPKIIAAVGTRNATAYGKEICEKIIAGLKAHDVMIVSGLAYGIDTCAHRAALEQGLKTISVLGHGLDRIYPYLNTGLSNKIVDQGGLLSEFMSGTKPDRENFPKRNRIIAGMSDATLVVEAAKRGGALITADIANSYNRDVFSVPGRIGDNWSEGCNYLIKTNRAALVQDAADIAYVMGWEKTANVKPVQQRSLFINMSEEEEKIADILRNADSMGIDEIVQRAALPTSRAAAALLNLEFQGIVRALPGKVYKLA
ncbi:MAG: DNA-processing protein DprA [Bacteroidales bacterium]